MIKRLLQLFLVLGSLQGTAAMAQTFQLQVAPKLGGKDSLILDVSLIVNGGSVALDATNLAFDITPSGGSALSPGSIQYVVQPGPLNVVQYLFSVATSPKNPGLPTEYYQINPSFSYLNGNGPRVTLTPAGSPYKLVRLIIPIASCGNFAFSQDNFAQVVDNISGAIAQGPFIGAAINTTPPTFSSGADSVYACGSATSSSYNIAGNTASSYYYVSSKGIKTVLTPGSSITVPFPAQPTDRYDTIYAAATKGSSCQTVKVVKVKAGPSVSFPLTSLVGTSVCNNSSIVLKLAASELNTSYQILVNGSLIAASQSGSAPGALNFTVTGLAPNTTTGYNFTYQATAGGCGNVVTSGPGPNVKVNACTLSPPTTIVAVSGNSGCGGIVKKFYAKPNKGVNSARTHTWSLTNTNPNPIATFVGGNVGDTIQVRFGISVTGQTDSLKLISDSLGLQSSQTIAVVSNPTPNPTITGSNFLNNAGADSATYMAGGGGSYLWTVSPAVGDTVRNPTSSSTIIKFSGPGTYTVSLKETSGGCSTTTNEVVVVSSCPAQPGQAGPEQTACAGGTATVYVKNAITTPYTTLQWLTGPAAGPFVPVATGIGGTNSLVYITGPLSSGTTYYKLQSKYFNPADSSGTCTNVSAAIAVTASPAPVAGYVTPTDTNSCKGSSVTLTLGPGSADPIVWQQSVTGSGVPSDWTTAATAAGKSYKSDTLVTANLTSSLYFRATRTNGCSTGYSNVVHVGVNYPPSAGDSIATATIKNNQAVCVNGQTDTLRAFAGFGYTSKQWISNGNGAFKVYPTGSIYVPDTADAGRNLILSWVVQAGSCAADVHTFPLRVDKLNKVTLTPYTSATSGLCAGISTDSLKASSANGTGVWKAYTKTGPTTYTPITATGSKFLPNATSAHVIYVSDTSSKNTTVALRYVSSFGKCAADSVQQTLSFGSNILNIDFSPIPAQTCYFPGSFVQLNAAVNGGTGKWTHSGSDSIAQPFIPSDTSANAKYLLSPQSQGRTRTLTWTVTSAACGSTSISRSINVLQQLQAQILTANGLKICRGDSIKVSGVALSATGTWFLDSTTTPGSASKSTFTNSGSQSTFFRADPRDSNKTARIGFRLTSPTCSPSTAYITLYISPKPAGSITTPLAAICAGASTDTLRATIAAGNTGVWQTPDGQGLFSSTTNKNTVYQGNVLDKNKTIHLNWVVTSPACGVQTYKDSVFVLNSGIAGAFPKSGTVNTPLPSICYPNSTDTLSASATGSSKGVWQTVGTGQFLNHVTGLPDPKDANARYKPSLADRYKTIDIVWHVIDTLNPACGFGNFTRSLTIRDSLNASFPKPKNICFGLKGVLTSDTLGAKVLGDTTALHVWSTPNGSGSFLDNNGLSNPNYPNARYAPGPSDHNKNITLIWTVSNGACITKRDTQKLYVATQDSITFNSTNVLPSVDSLCANDLITLKVTGGDAYNWSPSGGFPGSTSSTVNLFPVTTSQYFVTVSKGGCNFVRDTVIGVKLAQPLKLGPTGSNLCPGGVVTLKESSGNVLAANPSYQWSISGNPAVLSTNATYSVSPSVSTTYILKARTKNGCIAADSIVVNVQPNKAPLFLSQTFCGSLLPTDSVTLTPGNLSIFAGNSFIWFKARISAVLAQPTPYNSNTPGFLDTSRVIKVSVQNLSPTAIDTTYYTLYTNNPSGPSGSGCNTLTEVPVVVYPVLSTNFGIVSIPERGPNAGQQVFSLENQTVSFFNKTIKFAINKQGGVNLSSRIWNFGDTLSGASNTDSTNKDTVVHTFTKTGTYTVVLLASDVLPVLYPSQTSLPQANASCTDFRVRTAIITVSDEQAYFPNAFTPNGDNDNDTFRVLPYLQLKDSVTFMNIYDKWGNIVYKTDRLDRGRGWSGNKPDGKSPFDAGEYAYKVGVIINGNEVIYTGNVSLLR